MNGHGRKGGETLSWKLGLVNSAGKFLTAETFGFKINASGQTLRKKQMWTIEHDPTDDEVVYVKSHLGRYLAGDKKGEVTCNSEEQGEAEKFILSYHSDGSGRWAIQNRMHKYFFGGSEDTLRCYEKAPTPTEWWTPYLAVHPQVNMRSTHRKTYAHLAESDEIHCNERVPWGQDALITLEYVNGKYAVRTCDNRYLTRMGTLVNKAEADSLFTLEIRSGQFAGMALKDCKGAYLTAVGTNGCLKSREKAAKSDIVFQVEDSHPQVFITAHNGKKVSIKQGKKCHYEHKYKFARNKLVNDESINHSIDVKKIPKFDSLQMLGLNQYYINISLMKHHIYILFLNLIKSQQANFSVII